MPGSPAQAAAHTDPLAPRVPGAVQAQRSLQQRLAPPPAPEPALHAVPGCGQP
jgi:hypothetical protein